MDNLPEHFGPDRRSFMMSVAAAVGGMMAGAQPLRVDSDAASSFRPADEGPFDDWNEPLQIAPTWWPQDQGYPTLAYVDCEGEECAWWAADDQELAQMKRFFAATRNPGIPAVHPKRVFPIHRTSEERDAIQAILDCPWDIDLRLAYARLLSARGDLQGEFIKLQCQLAQAQAEAQVELSDQCRDYAALHAREWLRPLAALGIWPTAGTFFVPEMWHVYGMLDYVRVNHAKVLPENGPRLFEAYPTIREMFFDCDGWDVRRAWSTPELARLERLELRFGITHPLSVDDVAALDAASLEGISTLWLRSAPAPIDVDAFARFCESRLLSQLRTLKLKSNNMGAECAKLLADSPNMRGIRSLDVSNTPLGDEGVLHLLKSNNLESVRDLDINYTGCSDEVVDALVEFVQNHRGVSLGLLLNPMSSAGRLRAILGAKPGGPFRVNRAFFDEQDLVTLQKHYDVTVDDSKLDDNSALVKPLLTPHPSQVSIGGPRHRTRQKGVPVADLAGAFTSGHRFSRGEWHYEMEVIQGAELCLPTGKIVAADPGNLDDHVNSYFSRIVPSGRYPVDLAIRHSWRDDQERRLSDIACMRLRFSNADIAQWSMATTGDQEVNDLLPFQIYGYGVDVGMGSFADSSALVDLLRKYREQDRTLYDEFYFERVLPAYEAANGLCANILLDPSTGANLVVCASGCGDGCYASYWGLAADGHAACLVTDFGMLTHHANATRDVGTVSALVAQSLHLDLPEGELWLMLKRLDPCTLQLALHGEGVSNLEFEVHHQGRIVRKKQANSSYQGNQKQFETTFDAPLPDQATLVISYLDRIEPL